MLTTPYVTAPEFRAHPTYLDTNNLRTGGTQPQQDAALTNALLTASQWAEDFINMPLAAHTRVENARVRPDRQGRIRYHPEHAPVLTVTALAVGATPDQLDTVASPTVWSEQDGRILVAYVPDGGAGLAGLQFGTPPAAGELLAQWTYVAGWAHTQLTAPVTAGATSLPVASTIGITPGTVLRLWTPGLEEAVTVTAVAANTLTVAAVTNAHPAGMTVSALPATARQAVINYACALLTRPSPAAEANYSSTAPGAINAAASTSLASGHGATSPLTGEACRLLRNFQRIR